MVPHFAISAATVTGLLAVIWLLWDKTDSSLAHIRRLLLVAAIFYAARSIDWFFPTSLFRLLTVMSAAFIPLMMLLVIESLMRLHAPRWIKVFIAGGACGLTLTAFVASLFRDAEFSLLLFCFQLTAFAVMLYLIASRDKTQISQQENTIVARIALVLVILFPLLASDYQLLPHPVPIMMSGVAVLIGCWVLLHLHVRQLNSFRVVTELALLAGFALVATSFVAWYLDLNVGDTLRVWAMLFAFTMAAAIIVNAMKLHWQSGPMGSVTRGLTQADTLHSYLADLTRRELGCQILGAADLADFNRQMLLESFHVDGTIEKNELPKDPQQDSMSQSQMRNLLTRFGCARAYLVASEPLHIAIDPGNDVTRGPDTELLAAFGLARLLAERDVLRSRT